MPLLSLQNLFGSLLMVEMEGRHFAAFFQDLVLSVSLFHCSPEIMQTMQCSLFMMVFLQSGVHRCTFLYLSQMYMFVILRTKTSFGFGFSHVHKAISLLFLNTTTADGF